MSIQQKVTLAQFEAREKSLEIEVITNEEFAYEKEKRIHQDVDSIEKYFNEKEKQVLVEKKMFLHRKKKLIFLFSLHSNSIKEARLETLKLKEKYLLEVRESALEEAKKVVNDKPRYEKFLYESILQVF